MHSRPHKVSNYLALPYDIDKLHSSVGLQARGQLGEEARAVQALECNAQGRKVTKGKKKGRRTAMYFRLIRPASGLHAHDMQAQGASPPSWARQTPRQALS